MQRRTLLAGLVAALGGGAMAPLAHAAAPQPTIPGIAGLLAQGAQWRDGVLYLPPGVYSVPVTLKIGLGPRLIA